MITPKEIYLFPHDDSIVWADTDETPDQQGVKYIRADKLNKIKAEAIEEMIKEHACDMKIPYSGANYILRGLIQVSDAEDYTNKLRGEK